MVTETTPSAEVADAGATAEATQAEAQAEPTLAELQAKLAQVESARTAVEKQLVDWQGQAKGRERENQRLKADLQRFGDMETRLIERIDSGFALLLKEEEEETPQPPTKLEQYLSKVQRLAAEVAAPQVSAEEASASAAMQKMVSDAGLKPEEVPSELAKAATTVQRLWAAGLYGDAKDHLEQSLDAYKLKKQITAEAERAAGARSKAEVVQGLVTGSGPSEGVTRKWTLAVIERMLSTPEGLAEYQKHKDEIEAAQWRGEIK